MATKLKVGIWGLGRAGFGMHSSELAKYPEQFEIVAGLDLEEDRCEALREKTGCKTYTDADAFLADADIDLVTVATRSPDHPAHALKALEAGKYVFLEKPIALNVAQAELLVEANKKFPGKLYLRHNRRFEAPFNHIREIIASGILGDVYEVKLRRNGYQRRMDWQTIIDCGGGQLNNWGPHIIDHALRFVDGSVKEMWSDLKRIAAVGDAEDHLKIVIKGENDVVVDLEISGGAAYKEPEYIIFGTRGALTCTGNQIDLKYLNPEQKLADIKAEPGNPPVSGGFGNQETLDWIEESVKVAPANGFTTTSIWAAMYESIVNGVPFPVTIEEAVQVVWVAEQVKSGTPFAMK